MEMAKNGLPEEQEVVKPEEMIDGNVEQSEQLRLLELLGAGSYIIMGSSMLMLVLTFLTVRMILRREASRETETSPSPVNFPEPQMVDKTNLLIMASPTENLKSSEHNNDKEVPNKQLDSVMNSSSHNHSIKFSPIASHNSRTSSSKGSELRIAVKNSLPEVMTVKMRRMITLPRSKNSSIFSHSIEAAPTDSYRSRSPTISFLGEFVIGETSCMRKDINTKSRIAEKQGSYHSLSQEKRTPISELSTMDSPLYGNLLLKRKL